MLLPLRRHNDVAVRPVLLDQQQDRLISPLLNDCETPARDAAPRLGFTPLHTPRAHWYSNLKRALRGGGLLDWMLV